MTAQSPEPHTPIGGSPAPAAPPYGLAGGRTGGLGEFLRAASVVRKSARRAIMGAGGLGPALGRTFEIFLSDGLLGLRRGLALLAAQGERLPSLEADGYSRDDYQAWIARFDTVDEAARKNLRRAVERLRRACGQEGLPLVSVLLTGGGCPAEFLDQTLTALRAQIYPQWELLPACASLEAVGLDAGGLAVLERHAAQDARIRPATLGATPAEAGNAALDAAKGGLVAFLDAGDLLPEHALLCLMQSMQGHGEPDGGPVLAYSDEDGLDENGRRRQPQFKPDFNPELLLAGGLPLGLWACRTADARRAGGLRQGFGALTSEELAWRVLDLPGTDVPRMDVPGMDVPGAGRVAHAPRILLHRRAPCPGQNAMRPEDADAGLRMSRERLERLGLGGHVEPAQELPWGRRVVFDRPGNEALVSILIPTRDRADLLGACVHSLLERTAHTGYEVVIADNGSREEATFRLFESLPQDRVRIVRDEAPFNFSRLNNRAAREARGQYFCLLNNDIEVTDPDWLGEMLSLAARPDIGCVGARLWYPDQTLQHAGIIVGLGGSAGHAHRKLARGQGGYFGRAALHQALSAVTAACLLVRREVFEAVGGLDEGLPESYNDVDFCLRVQAAGYRNVWTPHAELTHFESASRRDRSGDHAQRMKEFDRQASLIMRARRSVLTEDPAYNPNLTRLGDDFGLAWPPRVAPLALL